MWIFDVPKRKEISAKKSMYFMQSHSHTPQFALGTLQQLQQWLLGRAGVGSGAQAMCPLQTGVTGMWNFSAGCHTASCQHSAWAHIYSTNNTCSRPIRVALLSFIPAPRDVLRATCWEPSWEMRCLQLLWDQHSPWSAAPQGEQREELLLSNYFRVFWSF